MQSFKTSGSHRTNTSLEMIDCLSVSDGSIILVSETKYNVGANSTLMRATNIMLNKIYLIFLRQVVRVFHFLVT